eukprot:2741381-Prymnesium_polylepis.1
MASRGLRGRAAGKRSEVCSRKAAVACARRKWHGDNGNGPSPCHFRLAACLGCSPTAFIAGGAARAGGRLPA